MNDNDFPFEDDILKALGRVVYNFAELEFSIKVLVSILIENAHLGNIVTTPLSFRACVDLADGLARYRIRDESGLANIERVLKRVEQAESQRNVVIHSVWGFEEDLSKELFVKRTKPTLRRGRGLDVQEVMVGIDELNSVADFIDAVNGEVSNLIDGYYRAFRYRVTGFDFSEILSEEERNQQLPHGFVNALLFWNSKKQIEELENFSPQQFAILEKAIELAKSIQQSGINLQPQVLAELCRRPPDWLAAFESLVRSSKGFQEASKELHRAESELLNSESIELVRIGVALVALGNEESRLKVEDMLKKLEGYGIRITSPVQQIWAGERDGKKLTKDLDELETAVVQEILELLEETEK